MNPELNFTLTIEQANDILAALAKSDAPFSRIQTLITSLHKQANDQIIAINEKLAADMLPAE